MGLKPTDKFYKDAVRIALTSGLTRRTVGLPSSNIPTAFIPPPSLSNERWLK